MVTIIHIGLDVDDMRYRGVCATATATRVPSGGMNCTPSGLS